MPSLPAINLSPVKSSSLTPIKRALLSVSDKTGLESLAQTLSGFGVTLLSTGGTAKMLRDGRLVVTDVADVTEFPEMMDGRVKTLHPKIHGAILADRDAPHHAQAMRDHDITGIDLVILNLYPFAQTLASGADYATIIENIDIGGPAMLRASAKNHRHVTIITDPADYAALAEELTANDGAVSYGFRQRMAQKAFALTARYDAMISQWLASKLTADDADDGFPAHYTLTGHKQSQLRYGENPHQRAALYHSQTGITAPNGTLAHAKQWQGKELSYNNLNDTEAAWALANEFTDPCTAIIKHANPCGVAIGIDAVEAFNKALACDPVSAYGGIIALNRPLTAEFVETMGKLFAEVIIAPEIEPAAAELLKKKKNLRLLEAGEYKRITNPEPRITNISGGFLLQDDDHQTIKIGDLQTVSARTPSAEEQEDMLFAFRVCKHVKSNAIVIARDGRTIGIGAGQMSRVDSVRLACWKAEEAGLSTHGCVLASDAFFPFDDNVHRAAEAGITALIQPGGSIRDEDVITAANTHKMAMVTTGIRHFRH